MRKVCWFAAVLLTDIENLTRTERLNETCKIKSLNNLWLNNHGYPQQCCHSKYNVILKISRHILEKRECFLQGWRIYIVLTVSHRNFYCKLAQLNSNWNELEFY